MVGYTVLGIDYFEGESVLHHLGKPGFDWREWMPPLQVCCRRGVREAQQPEPRSVCVVTVGGEGTVRVRWVVRHDGVDAAHEGDAKDDVGDGGDAGRRGVGLDEAYACRGRVG